MKPGIQGDAGSKRRRAFISGVVLLALLAGGIVAFHLANDGRWPSVPIGKSAEEVADTIRSWGAWAMAASVLLMVAHSFVPFPSEFVAIANGMVFGVIIGTAVTWTGAMLGAILAFALARRLGRPFVQTVLPARHAAAIDEWTNEQGVPLLLLSRFLPVVSFNLINYAAGLASVPWWTFLWTTGLGIAPLTVLMVWAGERMITGNWKLVLFVIAGGVAVSLLAFAIVRKRKSGKPSRS